MDATLQQRIDDLGPEYDAAIEDAMVDVTERGIVEDDDPDAFWTEVLAQAIATVDA